MDDPQSVTVSFWLFINSDWGKLTDNSVIFKKKKQKHFELCDMVCYSPGSRHPKMGALCSWRNGHNQTQYSGRLQHLYRAQLVPCGLKCVTKISSTSSSSLKHWSKAGRSHALMFFMPNSDTCIQIWQHKLRLFKPGNIFQILLFLWAHTICSLIFLFLVEGSGNQCALLLLQHICFEV